MALITKNEELKMLRFLLILVIAATPFFSKAKEKYPDPNRATLSSCMAAISIAEAHDNEWQAPFSMDECRVIAGKAIDSGYVLMDPKSSDDAVHRAMEDIR